MQLYKPNQSIDLPKHVLLPGFVNAHTHAAMYLFKGYGDDNDLSDWLNHYIWPMEAKFISSEFIADVFVALILLVIGGNMWLC